MTTPMNSSITNVEIADIQNPYHDINVVRTYTKTTNKGKIIVIIDRHRVTITIIDTRDTKKVIKISLTVQINRGTQTKKTKTRLTDSMPMTASIKITE